jgi:hypothetical protein
VLKDELSEAGAAQDEELLRKVQALSEALAKSEEGRRAAEVVGVKLDDLVVEGNVIIADVEARGTGVHIRKTGVGGDIEIKGVRAGLDKGDSAPNP